jgi:hypothetical protein
MLNLSRLRSISSCGYSNRSLQIIFHSPLLAEWTKSTKVHLYLQLYTYKNTLKPSYFLGGGVILEQWQHLCSVPYLFCSVPISTYTWRANKIGKNRSNLNKKVQGILRHAPSSPHILLKAINTVRSNSWFHHACTVWNQIIITRILLSYSEWENV